MPWSPNRSTRQGRCDSPQHHGGVDETFVVVNGDVLTDLDLSSLVAFHRESGAEGTIALHPVPDPSAFGVVPTDSEGRVTAFVEKPPRDEAPTNEINAGTYVFEPSVLDRIPAYRTRLDRTRDVSGHGAQRCSLRPVRRRVLARYGNAGGLPAGQQDLVSGQRKGMPVPGIDDRGDGVFLEGVSTIDGEVVGPSVIFPGCTIADGARVERSACSAPDR